MLIISAFPFFYYTALYKESEFSIQHCIKSK
nr:MAG TPA: hypothetical protein [Crassvirales sp.]